MDGALCCYDRAPYQKNTTITSTVTEDGCVRATIKCGEDGDKAMMILHTENYCEDHSTVEQVAEIKQLLIEHMDQKGRKWLKFPERIQFIKQPAELFLH